MDAFLIDNLLEDEIDLNIIEVTINNLMEPVNIPVRNIPTYNEGYMEHIIPNYNLSEFKNHFRLSRAQVSEICNLVQPMLPERHLVQLETKMLFFLWLLAKQESFLSVSDRFGFSKGTGHFIFYKILDAIVQLKARFIKWPNTQQCAEIQDRIENHSGKYRNIGSTSIYILYFNYEII